jgi:pre-mRNA-splicing factor 38B
MQYYFDTLLPRVPLPLLRQITTNLEKLKLPTKLSGITGDSTRMGSDDSTARRPPSVKASLSVSFGQRAPHRASTRDSSPVRKAILGRDRDRDRDTEKSYDRERDRERSYDDKDRDRVRDRGRDRDREREQDKDRERERERERERDRRERDRDYHRSSRERRDYDRDRYSSRRSRSPRPDPPERHRESPFRGEKKDTVSSNLQKLKDLYGDASQPKDDTGAGSDGFRRDTSTEVIRLGGSSSWR